MVYSYLFIYLLFCSVYLLLCQVMIFMCTNVFVVPLLTFTVLIIIIMVTLLVSLFSYFECPTTVCTVYLFKIKSGFDKRYLQKFLATISFEACSVLDHSCCIFLNDLFSAEIPIKATVDEKTCV